MAKAKKLPSGNWNVKVFAGVDEETGKRKFESFTAPTKRQAEYMAAEFKLNRKERKQGKITVGEALERYAESKKNILSESTYAEYKRAARRDLKSLHDVKLQDLTQEMVQKAINEEAEIHSPKTVQNMHGLLSAALEMFLPEFKLITTLPRKEEKERYIPTDADIQKLLSIVIGKPIEVPIILAALASLRRSEIAALTPEDITDTGVRVNKAMVKNYNKEWVIKRPKTAAGNRFSPLPPNVIEKVRAGVPTINPDSITHQFERVLEKCDLPSFNFHALRHYYASVLHALGVPNKYIMLNGGWKTESVLNGVYKHALKDRAERENEKVVDFFETLYDNEKAKQKAK